MNFKSKMIILLFSFGMLASCEKEDTPTEENPNLPENIIDENEEPVDEAIEVESFIYNGLNEIYLYKDDVPELADNYFSSSSEKTDFLVDASSPESLFDDLTADFDRFSFLTDDYNELEERFEGMSGATGIDYGIGQISNSNFVFGFIRYVLPGTSAEEAGLMRGTVFTEIDGQQLTSSNFMELISQNSFSINVAYVQDNQIVVTDQVVTLTDETYTENPVFIAKTLDIGGRKIGYLMYNSFTASFDDDLNAAFAEFQSNAVTDLVVDLRYNGGGSVESAVDLASMITGQFEGEVFMKEQWNDKYQTYYEAQNPEALLNRFDGNVRNGAAINSLNLTEVYVLTSRSSASASELIINGLDPYITVNQIGDRTVGKFQASVTLYDSDDFSREGASENHTYAMQPLVFKSINVDGNSDYINGLQPDVAYVEDLNNLGVLGDPSEPLLEIAINSILGRSSISKSRVNRMEIELLGESGMNKADFQKMYIDRIPAAIQ
ncbi:S41 family peptidase [Christiangramia portivictoriae]|uniref:S41 family peptidase n=1 Tax=Christiangramia portivictoriae TaxID=326069 RepID=UPI0003F62549|nr:S41 family peptidase [Christiangramia portivictoriae]